MPNLPGGTITFLFTDIEGSTTRWEHHPEHMRTAVARHDALLHEIMYTHHGVVFKTVGDAFYVAFSSARDALEAAITAQQALAREPWEQEISPLRVRMALHTGEAERRGNDYFGQALNRVARLLSAGHGGQVLLSRAALGQVRDKTALSAAFRDLGMHHLKDIQYPIQIFQLVHPALPADFPPLKTLDLRPHNLPTQLTPCVGRAEEVTALSHLFLKQQVRLVSLLGPGGVGKTRLGLQAATSMAGSFPHGIWFVELATMRSPEEVGPAILQALGLYETGKEPILQQLKARLSGQTLLFLDSFEQVSNASALITELLAACPQLKILITSRLALELPGEYPYHVSPLALPDPKPSISLEALLEYSAIAFFVQQAQLAKATFRLTRANAPLVVNICTRLDGLPLALELAAARTKLLSLPAMLKRLDRQLQLFTGSEKRHASQQQTLRGTIEWSYNLLNSAEKTLLNQLALFKGGCTFEATEAVWNAPIEADLDLPALLRSLIDKSLLRQQEGQSGEPRLRMMYIVREYVLEQWRTAEELEELGGRHATYYLDLAEQIAPTLTGIEQKSALLVLEEEHENMQAALTWYYEHGQIETGLRLAEALGRFWWMHGHVSIGRMWLDRLLASAQVETVSAALHTRGLVIASRMASSQNEYEQAAQLAEQALYVSLQQADRKSTGLAYTAQAEVAFHRGEYKQAAAFLEQSLAIQRALGDKRAIASLLNNLGNVTREQGNLDQAARLQEESLVLLRQLSDTWATATVLTDLGEIERRRENYKRAGILHEESLKLYRMLGYAEGIATSLVSLGDLARYQEDHVQSEKLYKESLALFRELGDKVGITVCLQGLAELAYLQAQPEHATRLFAQAEVTAYSIGTTILHYEHTTHRATIDGLRATLDPGVFEGLWTTGQSMSLEQATSEALNENVSE